MQTAVGPGPMLGQLSHPSPVSLAQLSHPSPVSLAQLGLPAQRYQDVVLKRPGFMGMNSVEERMIKKKDKVEQEEEEEVEEEEEEEREEDEQQQSHHNNNINHTEDMGCDLSSRVAQLHATLETLKRESEQKIIKLKAENEEATRVIARLQLQLKQQTEINMKNSFMSMKRDQGNSGSHLNSMLLSPPAPNSLELLLLERAKALQQQQHTPNNKPPFPHFPPHGFGGAGLRSGLFPAAPPLPAALLADGSHNGSFGSFGNSRPEELLQRWRQQQQQHHQLPPNIQEDSRMDITTAANTTPLRRSPTPSPKNEPLNSFTRSPSPSAAQQDTARNAAVSPPPTSPTAAPPAIVNGAGSCDQPVGDDEVASAEATPADDDELAAVASSSVAAAPSETGTGSPPPSQRYQESSSPVKSEDSNLGEMLTPQLPVMSPLSPYSSCNSGLGLPTLLSSASRIPKSDPMEGRLQDMLRYNMEKHAGQPIDTLATSRRVRELLSVHNIGQRLFAKYVLGLSQGTVSELLSKPKSWDKLTEKGRDSYRKMHAWAYDDSAILLLKTLIPRKGELVRPLSQSPLLIKSPHNISGQTERSPNSDTGKLNHLTTSSTLPKTDSDKCMSQEDVIARAYKEEFARMMGNNKAFLESNKAFMEGNKAMLEGTFPSSPLLKPAYLNFPGFPSLEDFPRPTGDLHQALQEELSRLHQSAALAAALRQEHQQEAAAAAARQQQQRLPPPPPPSHSEEENSIEAIDPPHEVIVKTEDIVSKEAKPPNVGLPPAFFPTAPGGGVKPEDNGGSPLQRMASITNALVSQPPPVNFPGSSPRPLKHALPPITQGQFDRYSHVNTDDTVRKIKEILSQYSISQRLFGEAVLGLSQGSVSDLLARPKPWHMLTQKGREPFIRMKIFLEDEGAVHRLVASQYKIAPDKLMRTGYSNPLGMPSAAPRALGKLGSEPLVRSLPHHFDNPLLPPTLRFAADPNLGGVAGMLPDQLAAHHRKLSGSGSGGGSVASPARPPALSPTPSLYEMAALTSELDTQVVTTKVKELLLANNLGQKLFGEAVLGLSQGSVSELLSKPKPWHMLSIKGREPFIRMQMWLNDPTSMDKLLAFKSEQRESSKRRYGGVGGLDSGSDRSSPVDTMDDLSNPASEAAGSGPAKRSRNTQLAEEHKDALSLAFALDPFPSQTTLEFLAAEIGGGSSGLDAKAVGNWFQNHRLRLKQLHGGGDAVEHLLAAGGQTFDPTKFRFLLAHRRMEMAASAAAAAGNIHGGSGGGGTPVLPAGFAAGFPAFFSNFGPAAAAAAAAAMFGLPQVRGGLQTNGGPLSSSSHSGGFEPPAASSGLDLRYTRGDSDLNSAESGELSEGINDRKEDSAESCAGGDRGSASSPADLQLMHQRSASRRKPALPQWVNPEWPAAGDDLADAKELQSSSNRLASPPAGSESVGQPINGVCVRNMAAYSTEEAEQEVAADQADRHTDMDAS